MRGTGATVPSMRLAEGDGAHRLVTPRFQEDETEGRAGAWGGAGRVLALYDF